MLRQRKAMGPLRGKRQILSELNEGKSNLEDPGTKENGETREVIITVTWHCSANCSGNGNHFARNGSRFLFLGRSLPTFPL